MPNGKETTSCDKYVKAWRDFYSPICDAFNMEIIGFDPGVLFKNGNTTIDLPNWFITQLNEVLKCKQPSEAHDFSYY